MAVLDVATRAMQANQVALQTTGNNIANVNTAGYSRQSIVLRTVEGQFTGNGYIGSGVDVTTIQRNFSEFLTRQSALTGSIGAGDKARADKLSQLEALFPGGANGLGASINDMINAFADVASAPTDLTARTVALTRIEEAAARMRSASQSLDDMLSAVKQELSQKTDAINSLTKSIADINYQISRAYGLSQSPNDLLDRRDQLIRDLSQYVQTTAVAADDGTVNIFLAGSQAVVLGVASYPVSVERDEFGDPLKNRLILTKGGVTTTLDDTNMGGGELAGLLKFENIDLVEARNLLGRLTLAVTSTMNAQHRLGLDLDGKLGGDLFQVTPFSAQNIFTPVPPALPNGGASQLSLAISDASKFVASDYEVQFTSTTAGVITRRSDQTPTNFDFASTNPITIDGFTISEGNLGGAKPGDRILIKPFSTAANNIATEFSSPRALAMASPVVGMMGSANKGSLKQVALVARSNPPANVPVTITFTGPGTYTRSDDLTSTPIAYVSGQVIEGSLPPTSPLSQWSLTLQGTPAAGDTYTVDTVLNPALKIDYRLNGGNATGMKNLRDQTLFDGASLTDGYAGMIASIGVRAQSANYAAEVSGAIAANTERERNAVSSVNLDEEAARLIQYQQAYQAAAKVVQIAQSIFETLMQTMTR